MSKKAFKLNWKYALGEIILIFIGISLAVGFQNWSELRKRKQLEKDVLKQLYLDIYNSLGDVRSDLVYLEQGVKSHYEIEAALNSKAPYDPELAFHFYFLQKEEYTYPIQTSYERLETIGLDLIKNDSLIVFIEGLFKVDIPRIEKQSAFYPDISEHFKPFFNQHFTPNTDLTLPFEVKGDARTVKFPRANQVPFIAQRETIGYVPLDFEALKNNHELRMLMSQAREYRVYKIRQFYRIMNRAERILATIETMVEIE